MDQAFDLYASPRYGWKRWLSIGLAIALIGGFLGYQWLTNVTPVSSERALDIFRAETGRSDSGTGPRDRADRTKPQRKPAATRESIATKSRPQPRGAEAVAVEPATSSTAQETASSPTTQARSESKAHKATLPAEGVYSWSTEGYEEVGGARRRFPEESQRIITRSDRGWNEHTYFSEEREIWTDFESSDAGASIARQRNKITFGPVTEDSTITFTPPMLVGPKAPRLNQEWSGEWSGETYGSYHGRVFEHGWMNIGGERVEVWGHEIDLEFKGEQEGRVQARVWVAPKYWMTVHEEYVQDVKADVGTYHAEWSMTVQSVDPRT